MNNNICFVVNNIIFSLNWVKNVKKYDVERGLLINHFISTKRYSSSADVLRRVVFQKHKSLV